MLEPLLKGDTCLMSLCLGSICHSGRFAGEKKKRALEMRHKERVFISLTNYPAPNFFFLSTFTQAQNRKKLELRPLLCIGYA
jgi:hypothetical protein